MALSGSFAVGTNGNVTGQLDWSATQDIANNYSDVSFTFKLRRTTAYDSFDDNQAYFYTWVNGVRHAREDVGYSLPKSMAWVTVLTGTTRVYHDDNGTKTFRLEVDAITAQFDVNYTDTWHTLNPIARASTLTSGISFTAGVDSLPITISRASTDFHHSVEVFVEYQNTNTYGGNITKKDWVYDSTTIVFTPSEIEEMYRHIGQYEVVDVIVRVWTYNSAGTQIGSYQDKYGYAYAVATAYPTIDGDNIWGITNSVPFRINNFVSGFNYDLTFAFGNFSKTVGGVTTQDYTMTFTTGVGSELEQIYAQIPNATTGTGTATSRTKYGTTLTEDGLGASNGNNVSFTAVVLAGSEPVFNSSQIRYEDTDATTLGVTGNSQYIIQNKSILKAWIDTVATAQNSSSIVRYEVTVNGVTQSSSSIGYFTLGTVNTSSNTTLTVKAIDSRGLSTSVSKTVNIVPYQNPVIVASATRLNGFEDETTLSVSGSVAQLNVNGTNKNAVISVKYQYRQVGGSYNTQATMTVGGTFPNYTVTSVDLNGVTGLDKLKSWEVLVSVADKLSTVTSTKVVPVGQPIMFMDATKKSVGFGMFPTMNDAVEHKGNVRFDAIDSERTLFWSPATGGDIGFYGNSNNGGGIGAYDWGSSKAIFGYNRNTGRMDFGVRPTYFDGVSATPMGRKVNGEALFVPVSDLNTTMDTGLYMGDETVANRPPISAWFYLLHFKHNDNFCSQTAYDLWTDSTYERRKINTIWNPWRKISGMAVQGSLSTVTPWTAYDGTAGYQNPYYWKTADGMVHLQGLCRGNGAGLGSWIGILPVGCRPNSQALYHVMTEGGMARVDVQADGVVIWSSGGTSGYISLEGISFMAEN
jgi:hypothetical protein